MRARRSTGASRPGWTALGALLGLLQSEAEMHLSIEGQAIKPTCLDAMQRGVRAMGAPDVEVIVTDDFDATVRDLLGSRTYSSDRGTGTVGAKTFNTPAGPVIVVNSLTVQDLDDAVVERLLVHESGHVLINSRGETLENRHHLASEGDCSGSCRDPDVSAGEFGQDVEWS